MPVILETLIPLKALLCKSTQSLTCSLYLWQGDSITSMPGHLLLMSCLNSLNTFLRLIKKKCSSGTVVTLIVKLRHFSIFSVESYPIFIPLIGYFSASSSKISTIFSCSDKTPWYHSSLGEGQMHSG